MGLLQEGQTLFFVEHARDVSSFRMTEQLGLRVAWGWRQARSGVPTSEFMS